ncbi:MAG: hypothetical protein A2015_04325 [Spirochaetes bacterium GWF1_31_7]|nr:MAG: hypothetical protein A2Y30_16945 [Spirochaetes bacterium GWE1_32_154]OHD52947.1 MAG: hypothetical protein A2015_04325 [Spirochaetes bacterium GWF1_31_7]OHD81419.1 MAG: hypothetical protein A2355_09520 [Spirochaetes bacterium RIFOXYB1_FULL_32_8]HBD93690.1 hypothetical protein [Spirochaetia bacterium]HBI37194.1 hypothetical protein [Spirochaetia bacterium]
MEQKKYKLSFAGIFILNFIFFLSHASINMLPSYLKGLGATNGYIGLFMNITSFMLMGYVLFFGKIANTLPRKPVLIAAHLLFVISMGGSFIFHDNLVLLFMLRITSSISYFFGYTINMNIMYDILPYDKRVRGIAFFGVSGILSNPVGAFIGENVIKHFDGYALFLSGMIIALFVIVWIIVLKIPENIHRNTISEHFITIIKRTNLKSLIFFSFIYGGAFGVIVSFLPNYTTIKLGKPNLSLFFTTFSIVAIFFRIVFYKILEILKYKTLIILSFTTILLSLINLFFLHNDFQLVVTGFLYGIGHSILFPVLSTQFVNSGEEHEKITLNNTFIAVNVAGNVVFAFILGIISDFFGLQTIYGIYGIIIFITLFIAIVIKGYSHSSEEKK